MMFNTIMNVNKLKHYFYLNLFLFWARKFPGMGIGCVCLKSVYI